MPANQTSAVCGAPLSPDAPAGECIRCLLGIGLEADEAEAGSEAVPPAPGSKLRDFGDFELLEVIARGGMGVVYKARQRSLDRLVALKMILAGQLASEADVKRFHTEAEAAASLDHPNIVPLYEVGEHDGQHYFTMKLVEGGSLSERISDLKSQISNREGAKLLATIARAVHFAHQHGILHRDLKPANILLDSRGEPLVSDFGLAKLFEPSKVGSRESNAGPRPSAFGARLTLSGAVLGSPSYMSPEQAGGKSKRISTASDVFSLGAILYEVLTGRAPFVGATVMETLHKVINEEPIPPSRLTNDDLRITSAQSGSRVNRKSNIAISADLETICLKCLEKDPARRYASAEALAGDLDRWQRDEPILARSAGRVEKVWRWCRRKPALAGTLALLVIVLFAGAGGVLWQWRRADAQRRQAEAFAAALRTRVYAADTELAFRAFQNADTVRARQWLDRYLPQTGMPGPVAGDVRGWEWRFLWEQCRRADELVLARFPGAVLALEFSPDGRRLIAADTQGYLRLWDLETRRELVFGNFFHDRVNGLAFSRDSQRVAVLLQVLGAALWDMQGRVITNQIASSLPIRHAAFSPDGSRLTTIAGGGDVDFWNLQGKQVEWLIPQLPDGSRSELAFSSDDRTVAVGDASGQCFLWDWRQHRQLEKWEAHSRPATGVEWDHLSVVFSPDGNVLATAGPDLAVRLWGAPGHRLLFSLTNACGPAMPPTFSADGRILLTCSKDLVLRRWDASTGRPLETPPLPIRSASRLRVSPDGQTYASSGRDGVVRLWRAEDGNAEREFAALPKDVGGEEFDFDSDRLLLATWSHGWRLWNLKSLRELGSGKLPGTVHNFGLMPAGPSGARLLTYQKSAKGGAIEFLDVQSGSIDRFATTNLGSSVAMEVSRDGRRLVVGGARSILAWDVPSRTQLRAWKFPAEEGRRDLRLSRDGAFIVTVSPHGKVHCLDIASGATNLLGEHPGGDAMLSLSQDGRLCATAGSLANVVVFDVLRQKEIASWDTGPVAVTSLAFSPDAQRLATGTATGTIQLWELETRREVARLHGHPDPVRTLAFRDADTLVSVAGDGIRFWRAPTLESIDRRNRP